jgi:DNA-binding response OmpR family regulator
MKNVGILLVDDDTAFRSGVEKFLFSQGYTNVRGAGTGEAALEMIKKETPDVVLLDLYLPVMNGLDTLREIHKIDETIAVFLLSCEDDDRHRHIASKLGAYDYLIKPIALSQLFDYVEQRLTGQLQPPPNPAL